MLKSAFAAFLGTALAAGPILAGQGEERLYDAQGRYEGRSSVDKANPEQRSLYDAKGKYVGRVMTSPDGSSRAYDEHGRYLGRATGDRTPDQKK